MILPVIEVEHYTDSLFRFRTKRPQTYRFNAGEFTMVGMPKSSINRAYSFTSGPGDDYLEFYSIKVLNGPLTGRLQHVKPGDTLEVGDKPTGSLTLANIELGGNLWLLATGTGIAPFISILRDPATYDCFDSVTVVWSVRTEPELDAYQDFINEMPVRFIPVITQAGNTWRGLDTRITNLLDWKCILVDRDPALNKVMICGSLDFNNDVKTRLTDWGWSEGNRKSAGTFVVERAFVG